MKKVKYERNADLDVLSTTTVPPPDGGLHEIFRN